MTGKNAAIALWSLGLCLSFVAHAQESAVPEPAAAPAAQPEASAPADASAPATEAGATSPDYTATAQPPLETIPVQEIEPKAEVSFIKQWFPDFDFSYGGFVRSEIAYSLDSHANPANQLGNPFNGRSLPRQGYVPPALGGGSWGTTANNTSTDAMAPGVRPFSKTTDSKFNYTALRTELTADVSFTQNLTLKTRVRAIYDPGSLYEEFSGNSLDFDRGGIAGGDPALYRGKPNYFDYVAEGKKNAIPLEWTGANYQVYFPTLLMEYTQGPLTVRAGNQQIAWGQALFFRVFDVVDGLDLRRHLVLDYAQEEFADERQPALGARINWQFNEELLADGFIQKFQPSVYPNPNTPYNFIPVQFTVHDLYGQGGYDKKFNYGLRIKGNYGQMGFQAMAVRRYNPDGVFRWTESGVNKRLPNGTGTLGAEVNSAYDNKTAYSGTGPCDPMTCRRYANTGEALSHTAFEASPGGVYSANEWFNYAGQVRLGGVTGLNASITEFPAAQDLYASAAGNYSEATAELNTFFIAAGGSLRGHIAREYFQEEVYGLGVSYVTEGEPGGILDQLIINLEANYTKGRTFTNTSLSRTYIKDDAYIGALVLEKYYRFTQAFPATYFVFQQMYRNVDDLFGRHLTGYNGTEQQVAPGVKGGAYYSVLAFQQPWPQDIYRVGFALLYDPRGSLLVQPGVRWKVTGHLQVDAFYTYINGALGGANPNKTLLSTIDYADEATVRLGYQF